MTNNNTQLVFLIGTPRSGTTMLGEEILGKCSKIHYLSEINHIWKHSNAYKRDEVLGTQDVNRFNYKYIKSYFQSIQAAHSGMIILDKTPINCLRIPFIYKIFPEAKFIFLYRDGFPTVLSISKEWTNTATGAIDSATLRKSSFFSRVIQTIRIQINANKRKYTLVDLYELPYYSYRFILFLIRLLFPNRKIIWGPRIPDLVKIAKKNSLIDACALQWSYCVEKTLQDSGLIPDQNKMVITYEKLLESPIEAVKEIADFIDIDITNEELKIMTRAVVPRDTRKSIEKNFSINAKKVISATNNKIGF